MSLKFCFIYLPAILFFSCHNGSEDWDEIKKSKDVYPVDTISAYHYMILDFAERRWVNISYRNYPYKSYCPGKAEFKFDPSLPIIRGRLSEDTFRIASMLHTRLKQKGICHFVGQSLSYDQLNIYFYYEPGLGIFDALNNINLPYELTMIDDPGWTLYKSFEQRK